MIRIGCRCAFRRDPVVRNRVSRGGGGTDTGFDELRDLCVEAGDMRSLAIGTVGQVSAKLMNADRREASRLADELVRLLESIGDPTLTVALSSARWPPSTRSARWQRFCGWPRWLSTWPTVTPGKGNLFIGSPLASH